jgi:hypothetical protein
MDDGGRVCAALDDDDPETRWWAWLAAVRCAELMRESDALREAIGSRAASADAHVAPLAAWAAMLVDRTAELTPALARSLAGTTALDALTLVEWLGARLGDLGAVIEPMLDGEGALACCAAGALIANAPNRWHKLWALTSETQLSTGHPSQRRDPPRWSEPTPRARAARDALGKFASALGPDAAAAIVEHAPEWWVLPILTGLGPLAQAVAPKLLIKLEAQLETSARVDRDLVRALAAIGGPIAEPALERLAATNAVVATLLGGLGRASTPMVLRLLAAPLDRDVHAALLDGLGCMSPADPVLLPSILRFLEAGDRGLAVSAIYAAGAFELDDATVVRLATIFVDCCGALGAYRMDRQLAADRMAPIWAARIEHPHELVALRCVYALGHTAAYGEDHVPALQALGARAGPSTRLGRAAMEAAENILNPGPMFPHGS